MTSCNGKKWPSRDRPDMIRSLKESIPSPTVCLVSLQDGKLVYERVSIGSNGHNASNIDFSGGDEVEKDQEVPLVAAGSPQDQ